MTATRDRRTVAAAEAGRVPWNERAVFGSSRGIVWWAAVLLALVVTIIGVVVDVISQGKPGTIFQVCFVLGCVVAVGWVQRKSLFGPMVQPPLILAITVPAVMMLHPGAGGGSALTTTRVVAMATPLITNFLVMAGTTVATILIGVFRLFTQRRPRGVGSTPPRQEFVDHPPRRSPAPRANPPQGQRARPPAPPTRAMPPQGGPRGREQSFDDW
jgi:hypothetical protein